MNSLKTILKRLGLSRAGLVNFWFRLMRNKFTGRPFNVDVNHTPYGPPVELSILVRARALARLATAFQKNYMADFPSFLSDNAIISGAKP